MIAMRLFTIPALVSKGIGVMPRLSLRSTGLAAVILASLGLPAMADSFVGGGVRTGMTQECRPTDPSITSWVTAVRLGYLPGQSNDGVSVLTAVFSDGVNQVGSYFELVESRNRVRGFGSGSGMGFQNYLYSVRPRIRAVRLRPLEPAGETDIGLASSIFVRFLVVNYWGREGCIAYFSGVLTNATTAAYVDSPLVDERPALAPVSAPLPSLEYILSGDEPGSDMDGYQPD
jgi:hypothetical protein